MEVKYGLPSRISLRSDGLQMDAERVLLVWRCRARGTERCSIGSSRTSQCGRLKWADQSCRCIGYCCTEQREWAARKATVTWVSFLSVWMTKAFATAAAATE